MKKILPIAFLCIFLSSLVAQVPQAVNYQTVVRDGNGNIIANQPVKLGFLIHDGSPTGTIVYSESDTGATNQFGLFTTAIGRGTVLSGNFGTITWSTGNKYLETYFYTSPTAYVSMGTAELLTVPYALYAVNGVVGPTGATGVAGANGTNGTNGLTGPTGPSGANGTNGTNGANGATGPAGPTGANGTNGNTGPTGPTGSTGAGGGATGTTGPTGANGANGSNGVTGNTGANGTNGTNGVTGATGPSGVNGTNGNTGATGPTGPSGINGTNGTNGTNGSTGSTGPSGVDGTNGTNGATGTTGATGILADGTATGNTPYWNGTTWVVSSANIYNDGGNVGIGTTNPASALDVNGNINLNGNTLFINGSNDINHHIAYNGNYDGPEISGCGGVAIVTECVGGYTLGYFTNTGTNPGTWATYSTGAAYGYLSVGEVYSYRYNKYLDVMNDLDSIDQIHPIRMMQGGRAELVNDVSTYPSSVRVLSTDGKYATNTGDLAGLNTGAIRQLRRETKTHDEAQDARIARLENLVSQLTGKALDEMEFTATSIAYKDVDSYFIVDARIKPSSVITISGLSGYEIVKQSDGGFGIRFSKAPSSDIKFTYSAKY